MENRHFDIKASRLSALIIIFCVLFYQSNYAQTLLVGSDDLPNAFTYCGVDTFSVDIRTPSGLSSQGATFSNIEFTITLPPGMSYFDGTAFVEDVQNAIPHGITGEILFSGNEVVQLSLADFLPNGATGDTVRVYLPVRASCDMLQDAIEYSVSYDYNNPSIPSSGSNTNTFVSDQIGLASPNLIIVDSDSDLMKTMFSKEIHGYGLIIF